MRLNLRSLRDPLETFYLIGVWLPTIGLAVGLSGGFLSGLLGLPELGLILAFIAMVWMFNAITWRLLLAFVRGHSIEVGPHQYPQIYELVQDACRLLEVKHPPRMMILHGHGLVELLVAKWFMKRGILILTSNLIDELTKSESSRQLMFLVGRQLGLIKTGFFRFWLVKHVLGRLTTLVYLAWQRRCHQTADKIGLLVAGDLYASEQALLTITVGSSIAPSTSLHAVEEQRTALFESPWAWLRLGFSDYPYMIDRLVRLRAFAYEACAKGVQANAKNAAVGVIPIVHRPIRSIPIMILHGHDALGRVELENFLLKRFPHVAPLAMIASADSAHTLPEKFERMAREVKGAIALLTPDDRVMTVATSGDADRARQNVIIEVGWFWGKLGRARCLLLIKGVVELPSDLAGVEVHSFRDSPMECSEAVRDFLDSLNMAA